MRFLSAYRRAPRPERSTPEARSSEIARLPKSSSPTAPTKRTSAPSRAAATAWFAPFPPGTWSSLAPVSVSPGLGRRGTVATRSRLIEPTTVRLGGKRAQVVEGAVEEVLAEVEEAGPERVAIRRRTRCGPSPRAPEAPGRGRPARGRRGPRDAVPRRRRPA